MLFRSKGEFDDPHGVRVHSNQVYVCDTNNHRIQVYDLDLKFIQSIGSHGKGRIEFDQPHDVAFDNAGNMYVVENENARVQVISSSGEFKNVFGLDGEGKLSKPTSLCIVDKFIYVSDWDQNRIAVYTTSGDFVTSFGSGGEDEGQFHHPRCITTCANGFIYVCDCGNERVLIF